MNSKLILLILIVVHLVGCTTIPQGNFTKGPVGLNKTITHDSVKLLVSLYPPAHTRFHITQSVKDPFGVLFIESLRQKGYSINESSIHVPRAEGSNNVTLYYVVDEPIKSSLYRVTLIVGQHALSRAYKVKNGTFIPLGFWVRKE